MAPMAQTSMPDSWASAPNPALALRRMAAALRRLRQLSGGATWQIDHAVNWHVGTLDNIEAAPTRASEKQLGTLLDFYGVDQADRVAWNSLREQAAGDDRLYPDCPELSVEHRHTYALTDAAARINVLSPRIPALLQTPGYARILAESTATAHVQRSGTGRIPDLAERLVTLNVQRQHMLQRDDPPKLHAVLLEVGLQRLIGSKHPTVAHEQLSRLIDVAALPHVAIQLLPSDAVLPALSRDIIGESSVDFVTVEFAEPGDPPGWYCELPMDWDLSDGFLARFNDDPAAVNRLLRRFGAIAENAFDPDESLQRLVSARDRLAGRTATAAVAAPDPSLRREPDVSVAPAEVSTSREAQPAPNSTLAGRRLAAELRRLRKAVGLTHTDVAAAVDMATNTISRYEHGSTVPDRPAIWRLLDVYGVTDDASRSSFIALRDQLKRPGPFDAYKGDVPAEVLRVFGLTAGAARIRVVRSNGVPYLLQVPEYTRGLLEWSAGHFASKRDVESETLLEPRVALIGALQEALRNRAVPPKLDVVLSTRVLEGLMNGWPSEVAKAQLERLIEVAGDDHATICLLPPEQTGLTLNFGTAPGTDIDGVLLDFANPADDAAFYSEVFLTHAFWVDAASCLRERSAVIDAVETHLNRVANATLGPDESLAELKRARDEITRAGASSQAPTTARTSAPDRVAPPTRRNAGEPGH